MHCAGGGVDRRMVRREERVEGEGDRKEEGVEGR